MSFNIPNSVAFLRTSREFPEDSRQLSIELNRSYLDIAEKVNSRIIGLYSVNKSSITGSSWFISGNRKQQSLRQVYEFSDSSLTINHGLNFSSITNFTNISGVFYDGTSWQTLPYVDVTSATNQINVRVTSSQIIITKGGGSPPSVSNGLLVLEYLANP